MISSSDNGDTSGCRRGTREAPGGEGPFRLTSAEAGDAGAIAALERVCFQDPWPEDLIERLWERFTVIRDGAGAVRGYLALSWVLDEGNIDNIAVAPGYRRRGLADALVTDALRRGRAMGLSCVTLEVRASNTAAIQLYAKHGFARIGCRRGYYERPREDAVIMMRTI